MKPVLNEIKREDIKSRTNTHKFEKKLFKSIENKYC